MRKRRRYRMDWGGYLKEMQDPNDLLIQNQMSKQAKADAFNNSFGMKLLDTAGQAALNTGLSIATSAAGSALKGAMANKALAGADKVGELQKANDALEAKGDKMTMEDQVAFDKNNNSIKKWNRKINNYKGFGDVSGDLMRGLGGLASSGISMAINSFDTGGEVQDGYIPIEAEGGELIQTPYDDEAQYIEGPDHEQGGVDLDVPSGSVVYSKRVKDGNGVSMAERKVKRDRLLKKWQKKVKDDPTNELHKQTLAKVQRNAQIEEANDVQFMEMHRQAKDYSNYFKKATMNYGKGNGKYLAASRGKYASGGMTAPRLQINADGSTFISPYGNTDYSKAKYEWIKDSEARHNQRQADNTSYNPHWYRPEDDDNMLIERENARRRNLSQLRIPNNGQGSGRYTHVPNDYDYPIDKRDATYVNGVMLHYEKAPEHKQPKPVKITTKQRKSIKSAVNKAVKKHVAVIHKQAKQQIKQQTKDLKTRTEEFLKRTQHLDNNSGVKNKLSTVQLKKKANDFIKRTAPKVVHHNNVKKNSVHNNVQKDPNAEFFKMLQDERFADGNGVNVVYNDGSSRYIPQQTQGDLYQHVQGGREELKRYNPYIQEDLDRFENSIMQYNTDHAGDGYYGRDPYYGGDGTNYHYNDQDFDFQDPKDETYEDWMNRHGYTKFSNDKSWYLGGDGEFNNYN